jgi:hypothetical protein
MRAIREPLSLWDPTTLATTINRLLINASNNTMSNANSDIDLLATKGNAILKYKTLVLIDTTLLPPWVMARIITIDDDQTIFSHYAHEVNIAILIKWIHINNAKSCAYELASSYSDITDVKLLHLAVMYCMTLPADICRNKIYELHSNIASPDTIIDVWASNKLMRDNVNYTYWIENHPKYRGKHMCLLNRTCKHVVDILSMLESIYYHREELSVIGHAFNKIAAHPHDWQERAWSLIRRRGQVYDYFTGTSESDEIDWSRIKITDGLRLYIPSKSLTIAHYNLLKFLIYPLNHVYTHMLHLLHNHNWEAYVPPYFCRCVDAVLGPCGAKLTVQAHTTILHNLHGYWQNNHKNIPSGRYLRYFPLIRHIKKSVEIATTDHIVKGILITKIRKYASLSIIPIESVPIFFDDLPDMIEMREFNTYPSKALIAFENSRTVSRYPGVTNAILNHLLIKDMTSSLLQGPKPVIDELTFSQYISGLSDINNLLVTTSHNFGLTYQYVMYYLVPEYRLFPWKDTEHLRVEALKFGLRTDGCAVNSSMIQTIGDRPLDLPHITLSIGYDDDQYHWLIQLYYDQLEQLSMTATTLCHLLCEMTPENVEFLKLWSPLHHGCNYDISSLDLSQVDKNLFTLLICHQVVDRDTLELDTLPDAFKAIMSDLKDCPICTNYILEDELTKTRCGHIFHNSCLETWLHQPKDTCPVCRGDIDDYDLRDHVLS